MLSLPPSVRVFLCCEPVDMRKSFNGLAGIVRNEFDDDPMNGHLFVFLGKQRDKVKILFWDRDGWALFYKRLERGRFHFPKQDSITQGRCEIESAQLGLMLEGIDLTGAKKYKRWRPK